MATSTGSRVHRGRIVMIDGNTRGAGSLRRTLAADGHALYYAPDGETALELVRREGADLVVTHPRRPAAEGIRLCHRIKSDPATRLVRVMLLADGSEPGDRLAGIDAGADEVVMRPVDAIELRARVKSLVRLKRFTDDLDSAEAILRSLALTLEARDGCTSGHSERMAGCATMLGTHLGLTEDEIAALRRGAYLHDLGKVGIPDAILQKAGPLSADEFEVVKRHTTIGDELCSNLRLLRGVRPIVRHHHERRDGSGYPDGLAGDDIPLLAQIVGIIDVYDALTSHRPYRRALTPEESCQALEREVELGWRRGDLVGEFTALCRAGHFAASVAVAQTT